MTDTELISAFTGLVSLAKSVAEAGRALVARAKGGGETEAHAARMLELANSLEASIFSLQKEALKLQEENGQLRAELSSRKEWFTERQRYQPAIQGRATILLRDEQPGLYFCPTCFDDSKSRPVALQPHVARMGTQGSHMCPGCGHGYRILG